MHASWLDAMSGSVLQMRSSSAAVSLAPAAADLQDLPEMHATCGYEGTPPLHLSLGCLIPTAASASFDCQAEVNTASWAWMGLCTPCALCQTCEYSS